MKLLQINKYMFIIIKENLKYIIAGLSAIWIVGSIGSCVKDSNKTDIKIIELYTTKGYVQKKTNGCYGYIWTKQDEQCNDN